MPSDQELQQMYAGADAGGGASDGSQPGADSEESQEGISFTPDQVAAMKQLAAAGKYEDLGKLVAQSLQQPAGQ